ncbi:hypothetical protein B0H17DRAFT_202349 [Mycena rosella]|uniref:Carrier domain-containing protein n=1 Tax=Mycena rosella TaxID=1033263 RepID=A0AAD7D288_MYCRO|nr:hypothetical protein B0H17DRAFT_202349 [Mycena rosella]
MPTYTPVPVDGVLSILQIFEFQATTNPHHPLFRHDSTSARDGYEDITWPQAVKMFDTTAQILRRRFSEPVDHTHPPVVGILAATGSILYACLIHGALRAGCIVFPLSTRNSDAAIAHLIAESGVKYLLVSPDGHMQDLARKAKALLHSRNVAVEILPIPTYEEVSDNQLTDLEPLPPLGPIHDERVLIIAHSSGSTSFPKVIPLTHRFLQTWKPSHPVDFSSWVQSAHGSPMFHVMGGLSVIRAAYTGTVMAFFPPTANAVIATPERILRSAVAARCTTILCPPTFLEEWAKDASSIEQLRSFTHVSFAGGPLPQHAGNILEQNGVPLSLVYGSTEAGAIAQMWKTPHKEGWEYFQLIDGESTVLVPIEDDSSGLLFHLIIKESPTRCLALTNTEIDGVRACDTGDILQQSPTNSEVYRLYGRVDDQIMHSNGEKTNPGPLEHILAQNPLVKTTLMFGRGKPHAGVLVMPSEEVSNRDSFRDAIWPTVEEANKFAPSHSRLFKEMIILSNPSKPFHLTAKGTLRRNAILQDYAQEIKDAYDAFDQASFSSSAFGAGSRGGENVVNDALEIVRTHVHAHVNPSISDNEDLFEAGADSLLAARIRRDIMQSLSEPSLNIPDVVVQSLPNDVVFTSPSIGRLASFIHGIIVCSAALPQTGLTFMKSVPASILDQKDNTIVRLREPEAGEPPLILVHGGTGLIYSFAYMQTHFKSGLWAIQITDETPQTSFAAQTDFYYAKVKESQPTGPYRLGGHSAGTFFACRIAKLLEANGDKVVQLALIDSSPLLAINRTGLDPSANLADPQNRHDLEERSVRGVCKVYRSYNDGWWNKFAAVIWNRWNGRLRAEDMTELMRTMYENLIGGSANAFEFALSQARGDHKGYDEVLAGMVAWMKEIQSPVTVYKATHGIIENMPPDAQAKWRAFGVDWAREDVRVVEIDANHSNIVAHDEFVEDIQKF